MVFGIDFNLFLDVSDENSKHKNAHKPARCHEKDLGTKSSLVRPLNTQMRPCMKKIQIFVYMEKKTSIFVIMSVKYKGGAKGLITDMLARKLFLDGSLEPIKK